MTREKKGQRVEDRVAKGSGRNAQATFFSEARSLSPASTGSEGDYGRWGL
jgi:hypothetical protein